MAEPFSLDEPFEEYSHEPPASHDGDPGPLKVCHGIRVNTRLSLSRNLATFPFFDACSDDQREHLRSVLLDAASIKSPSAPFCVVDCQRMQLLEQQFLSDLQAIVGLIMIPEPDPCFGETKSGEATLTSPANRSRPLEQSGENDESATIESLVHDKSSAINSTEEGHEPAFAPQIRLILNHEDHLEIEVESLGEQLTPTWTCLNLFDDQLQQEFSFAYHPQFGYLTACPSRAGTTLRASVLLHLPAAVAMGSLPDLLNRLSRHNVAIREVFGDPGGGDFFRASNLATLGFSELDLIEQVRGAVDLAITTEQQARQKWLQTDLVGLTRTVKRAVLDLQKLELTSTDEHIRRKIVQALSRIRLGHQLGLLAQSESAPILGRFQLIQLQEWLHRAIAQEDYRAASRWRDRIKRLGETACR